MKTLLQFLTKSPSKTLLAFAFAMISLSSFAQTNPCNLKPDFSFKVDCRTVQFKSTNNISGMKYSWTFGDGSYANTLDPKKTYWKSGSYQVCLQVTYKGTNNTECKETVCKTIKVGCEEDCHLTGEFGFKVDNSGNVYFNAGSNYGYTYVWNYGDGTTGTGKQSTHFYKKPGTYEVCVTIISKDQRCKIRVCRKVVIEAKCNIIGDFKYSVGDKNCVKFEGTSNTGSSYVFSVGEVVNGVMVYRHDKSFTYCYSKCGVYEVCMVVYSSDKKCSTKICKKIEIKCPCNLKPDFIVQIIPGTNKAYFSGSSTGGVTYTWSYGDGTSGTGASSYHIYSKPGTYKVCLTVCDADKKCCQEICKTIVIPETKTCGSKGGNFGYKVDCKTGIMTFEGFAGTNNLNPCLKWYYSFGDGTYGYSRVGTHTYTKDGTYQVCMKVKDTCNNCDTTVCQSVVIKNCNYKCKFPKSWSFTNSNGILNVEGAMVTDSGVNNGCFKYSWDFGDKTTGTGRITKHQYANNGTYTVCMKVVDTCHLCDTMICKSITVNICNIQAYFTFDSFNSTSGIAYFTNVSSGGNTYYWDFGDGTSSKDKTPKHTFAKSGTYTICLTVFDANNTACSSKICKTITVQRRSNSKTSTPINTTPEMKLYPNPAQQNININWEGFNPTSLQVMDLKGSTFITKNINGGIDYNLNVAELAQGVYLVKLTNGNTTKLQKFIKN